ncbi:hypothetical protein [Peribacillus sp. Hz7]|uniref:hypothetical protein n=1 Tax=Peribacillus sp. Hz7 TaxID=3344873 RepID=UPI0035C99E7B
MNKLFKISWHAFFDENTFLEGRSIVEAETDYEAANKLIFEKAHEYRLRRTWIRIDSLVELIS